MTEVQSKWPFPGDSPIVRARKTALAYRETARGLRAETQALYDIIRKVDPRVVEWVEDPDFRKLYSEIQAGNLPVDDPVRNLDARIHDWGEDWHADIEVTYDEDDWVPVKIAAKIVGVQRNTINRARLRGRITGKHIKQEGDPGDGQWTYRVGDLLALSSEPRTRDSRVKDRTDTVQSSGSSDPQ